MATKRPAGMKTGRLWTAQGAAGHAALQRKGVQPHDPPPPKSFVDDVKRKKALKKVMSKHTESLFDNSEEPVDGVYQKEDVNYRYAADPAKACEHCEHFIAPYSCEIVAGLIRDVDVCDKFEPLEKPGHNPNGLVPSQLIVQSYEAKTVTRRKMNYVQEWLTAKKDPTFATCIVQAEGEVSPPGWEGTVKAMKKHPEIDNPWALSWYMKGQGMKSHKNTEVEGGPGSGPRKGGGLQHGKGKQIRRMAKRADRDLRGIGAGAKDRTASANMFARALAQHAMRRAFKKQDEGGPGSGPKGGRSKFQPEKPDSDEDSQVDQFTRREKPAERRARIKSKKVDPHQAKAIARAFLVVQGEATEGVMGTMAQGLANLQPDHQQFEWTGLSHGRRGDT